MKTQVYLQHSMKLDSYNKTQKAIRRIFSVWQLYLMILIPLLYVVIFKYAPMYGSIIAFKKFMPLKGIINSPWIGLENFERFFNSPDFWLLMKNTLGLSIYGLVAGFPIPILLALSLNYVNNIRYKKTVQMITYIPYFISVVVMVGILMQVFNVRSGAVNLIIKLITGESIDFLGNPYYFKSLYVWSGVWQETGWSSIIYIAALASVDLNQHEAAIVDGAGKLQRIWHIDIPGILPTAVIMLILRVGTIMNTGFEKVLLMQNPLNLSSSEVIETFVYKIGLGSPLGNYSYSAAVGLFQSVVCFVLIVCVNTISKKVSETSLW